MLDCMGKEIHIGDKVVCSDMRYADLLIGEVIGFTPKKARIRYVRSEYYDAYGQTNKNEQLKESYQIFVYEFVDKIIGCEFCNGMKFLYGDFSGSGEQTANGTICINTEDTPDFNFCPMCGREL